MSVSPDYTPFVDLTLYDKSPSDILAAGVATLQSRLPDWVPTATNIEMLLMEAVAVEVGEALFTLNRLPGNLVRQVLTLYGVTRDPGAPPVVSITFTAQDNTGYTVPSGTEVAILLPTGEYMSFFTQLDLNITAPNTTGTITAAATVYTNIANGIASGTDVEMVDSIVGIVSAVTSSDVADGELPETEAAFTQRGVQRLQRLVDTLVIPDHFVQAALENTLVYRANAIDNWNSEGTNGPGEDPGYIAVVVYGESDALTTEQKAALQADLELRSATNLIVTVIDPTVVSVNVTAVVKVDDGYTEAAVLANVVAALQDYLAPSNWDWSGTVRVNELISVIDQVTGVSYVSSLTLPATDIQIGEGLTIVNAGTLNITALQPPFTASAILTITADVDDGVI